VTCGAKDVVERLHHAIHGHALRVPCGLSILKNLLDTQYAVSLSWEKFAEKPSPDGEAHMIPANAAQFGSV
jgi:hypothetical protein